MSIFDGNMPYTNLHELNNDWIIKTVKEVKDKTELIDDSVEQAKQSEENAKTSEENALASENNAREYYNDMVEFTSDLSAKVATNTQNIAVNTARIDNIAQLPEGGTSGDAELQDIRVWYNGKTSNTAGDSVRGQIEYVTNEIYNEYTIGYTQGQFINTRGTIFNSSTFALSDSIPVSPGTTLEVTTELQGTAALCVFNADGGVLLGITGTSGLQPYTVNIPMGASYMRFSCYYSQADNIRIRPLYASDSLNNFISINGSDITRSPRQTEVIDGYLLTKTGAIAGSTQWEISDYIPVYPSSDLLLYCYLYGSGAVVLYDENKNVLYGIDGNNASTYGGTNVETRLQLITLANSQNVRYVRFSCWKNYFRVTQTNATYRAPWKDHAEHLLSMKPAVDFKNRKILVISDSISSDSYGNYKKWVTDLIEEEKLLLNNVNNSSQHATGFVATNNGSYQNFVSRLTAIPDKASYDMVIVFGGINDYVQSIPLGDNPGESAIDTYFKPAVDYFFNYLIENFTQARICVLTPLRTYNIYPNTIGVYQQTYSDYIKQVAKSYCLPVLDLTNESGFCPFNDTFKNRWTLIPQGYTNPDGTHPTEEYEKKYLAPMIWEFIKGLME